MQQLCLMVTYSFSSVLETQQCSFRTSRNSDNTHGALDFSTLRGSQVQQISALEKKKRQFQLKLLHPNV